MKQLLLALSAAILFCLPWNAQADDSLLRGTTASSGLDPDLPSQFYETISSSSPLAVVPQNPLDISGTIPSTRGLTVSGSVSLAGNVLAAATLSRSGSGVATEKIDTTYNTAIQIYPKNLPAGAYEVYVVMSDTTDWRAVGSFVMPAIITTTTDGPNNTLIYNNQTFLLPLPAAPQPDSDFTTSPNSLGYNWLESGIVRFATSGMPTTTYKAPKVGKTPATVKDVPSGDFDDSINPFEIYAIVVENAYTGKFIYSAPLKGNGSYDTTNTNLLSLVMPAGSEPFAGGIANLKTSFSRTRSKTIRNSSLNFSATGLPSGQDYKIQVNGDEIADYKVTSNSKGALVITSSNTAKKKVTNGLTVIAGTDINLYNTFAITLTDFNTGEPVMWVSF